MADANWKVDTSGGTITLLSTDLNSLANNTGVLGAARSAEAFLYADLELNVTFGTNPTANSLVEVYLVRAIDGTNYEDTTTAATAAGPANGFVGGFPVRAVTTAQRIALPKVELPAMDYKWMVINKTGQTMAASGNTLTMKRYTEQAV